MEPAVGLETVQDKEAITASNRQSLLLKLPREIKDQIYELVGGGNILHFESRPNARNPQSTIYHFKCPSKITEDEAQASFDASTSPWFDEGYANRHKGCDFPKLFCHNLEHFKLSTLDLRFLRTCRQIYDEAKDCWYNSNVFSFDAWHVLAEFVKKVSWVSRIRRIRLVIRSLNDGSGPIVREKLQRNSPKLQEVSHKLTGVERIHIHLEQLFYAGNRSYDKRAEQESDLTKQLLCLAGTNLKSAAVTISDALFRNKNVWETTQIPRDDALSQERRRWTMKQKQEYARFLQNALLQHRGKSSNICLNM